jgi:hypothetical protein
LPEDLFAFIVQACDREGIISLCRLGGQIDDMSNLMAQCGLEQVAALTGQFLGEGCRQEKAIGLPERLCQAIRLEKVCFNPGYSGELWRFFGIPRYALDGQAGIYEQPGQFLADLSGGPEYGSSGRR